MEIGEVVNNKKPQKEISFWGFQFKSLEIKSLETKQ